jgi:enoyl-CoA hydratase/carnithine racemase
MIRSEVRDGITRVVLDRPGKANALSGDMLALLAAALDAADTPVLVLSGAGRVFSAGADLSEIDGGLATDPVWERISSRIASYPGLTIAALNGTAAGGSLGMVLACDLRIAVPDAAFFYPVLRLGQMPQPTDPARLVALVGPARAKLMLLGGARWRAEQALAFGLIDQIAAPEDLDEAVSALGVDAVAARRGHLAALKSLCFGGEQ